MGLAQGVVLSVLESGQSALEASTGIRGQAHEHTRVYKTGREAGRNGREEREREEGRNGEQRDVPLHLAHIKLIL